MKKLVYLAMLFVFPLVLEAQQTETVHFSKQGGFCDEGFYLDISCENPDNHIYYTTNGSTPTTNSHLYTTSLYLDENMYSKSEYYKINISPDNCIFIPDTIKRAIVIRAAAFDNSGNCVSKTFTNTYIIKSLNSEHYDLPVISICADSLSLFDYDTGIFVPGFHFDESDPQWTGNYYERGKEWERMSNVEFYETDNSGFNQIAGLRTHGGNSRRFLQKGMKLYARNEYGTNRFYHKMFEDKDISAYKRLVLKPFKSSWTEAGVQDYICGKIASNLNIDVLASRPTIVYLNGEYWGIYFIQEKFDERYLEENLDVDPDDCNIMGNWYGLLENGDNTEFLSLVDWMYSADLCDSANYNYIADKIDIDNFIDYQIFEIYSSNTDWPSNNTKFWQDNDNKWRWIFYDGDACLINLNFDTFGNAMYVGPETWPSSTQSTLFLRKLLQNNSFKTLFLKRFYELLSSNFKYDNTVKYLSDIQNMIKEDIHNQSNRFRTPENYYSWLAGLQNIDTFLQKRPVDLVKELNCIFCSENILLSKFQLYPNPTQGIVKISTNLTDMYSLSFYNILGTKVLSYNSFSDDNLDLSSLPSGIYIVVICSDKNHLARRLVIE